MKRTALAIACLTASAQSQVLEVPLSPEGVPGAPAKPSPEIVVERGSTHKPNRSVRDVHNTSLSIYLPPHSKNTGTSIVICPGGGYGHSVAGRRRDLRSPNVPFVAGEPGPWRDDAGSKMLNATLVEFADGVGTSAGPTNKKADPAHFDSISLREFGRRYAQAMLRAQDRVK